MIDTNSLYKYVEVLYLTNASSAIRFDRDMVIIIA